ncbi:hypothetical protein JG687_00016515 [Phytophthora cactorum]|uniref:DDE-1 domain-containing protein n=1 Tax=Phytophthora cactorum TaxID=29920 RepID=A0A329SGV8_9STRA|nr:hypothetical protein PC120_g1030 [Phytophthora cactorum]KAG6946805.1 hypothetical protein JG687_00016515 [Phytophthora cactorum]RAW35993.1 hypothetical protein PC110_g7706 [Phytophthora cactorum]
MFVEPSTSLSSKGWVKMALDAVFFCVHLRWRCLTRIGDIQTLTTPRSGSRGATTPIEEVRIPTADGCRMLMLDRLRVHKMESAKQHLEDTCCTKVQYVPPGITGLSQPMNVSVMRSFKSNIQYVFANGLPVSQDF